MTPKFKTSVALAALLAAVPFTSQDISAAPRTSAVLAQEETFFGHEPWPGQRTVLLLPLQFGESWNLDPERMAVTMPVAEQKMQQALQRTGKFSTMQVHRYNPLFLRAVQDGLRAGAAAAPANGTPPPPTLTREQLDNFLAAPNLANSQSVLAAMPFEQPAMIAEVFMDEVTVEAGSPSPSVLAQVTGKLYEVGNPVPVRTVVVTSEPTSLYLVRQRGRNRVLVRRSPSDRLLAAADNAFNQLAREFVRPVEDITLPNPVLVAPDGTVTVVSPAPAVIEVPRGQVLGTFTPPAPAPPVPATPPPAQ